MKKLFTILFAVGLSVAFCGDATAQTAKKAKVSTHKVVLSKKATNNVTSTNSVKQLKELKSKKVVGRKVQIADLKKD